MFRRDPVSESIDVWSDFRDAIVRGTNDWMDATTLLAFELRRAGRHAEALELVEEFLEEDRAVWQLLDAAESCVVLGDYAKARRFIDEARVASQAHADSPRHSEREEHSRVVARIEKLMQEISEDSGIP